MQSITDQGHIFLAFEAVYSQQMIQDKEALVLRIKQLKKEKDVVILSHYYMPAELQFELTDGGFVDFVGDSLGLSVQASKTEATNILFCGVKFMAETALLVNEGKQVYMPDPSAGCSLASSISAEDIRGLKKQYPGVPVMGYINTYAETKTELDICCTSRNAVAVAASLEGDKIIFVPDVYMGENLQKVIKKELGKDLILWNGSCEVHEQFRNFLPQMAADEGAELLFHWEVPEDITGIMETGRKGIVGSTGDILKYVQQSDAKRFYLASECDLSVALMKENADKEFVTPCVKCPYMKQNTLEKLLDALEAIGTPNESAYRVALDKNVIDAAKKPVLRMLECSN
ncbi:MAG: quinolinate synthase [Bacteroidetes bacterium B1(2017)]|nr:MAG: quinolinate synthase [Bacteroidetes bacterium B1(2017)]